MISAIILAGGKGKRMGQDISKQFIELNHKPVLYYTLKKFINNKNINNIILVVSKDDYDYCKNEVLKKYDLKVNKIVLGGKERQDSVYNGIQSLEETEIVLIHDGARPFISDKIINDGIEFAKEFGAAAPGVMPKDTIKIKDDNNFSVNTPNRKDLVSIQTPQIFRYEVIKECHEIIKENGDIVTDDTMVVEKFGHKVYLYDGEYTNIKITTPEDLILAEKLV